MISHALPKTKPVGDDLQLTALFGQPMMIMTLKASSNKCNKVWKMQIHFYKDIFTAFAIIIIKLPNARKWTRGGGMGAAENWMMHMFDLQGLNFSSLPTEILYLSYEQKLWYKH